MTLLATRRADRAESGIDRTTLVTFAAGGDLFAAPVEMVERVLRFTAPSVVPNMPSWMEGVVSYRERMVPIIDLRRRFGREAAPRNASTRIVIFGVGADLLGLNVDAVLDVLAVDARKISAPPAIIRGLSGEYLIGLVEQDGSVALVLDVARVLSSTEQLELHAVVEGDAALPHGVDGGT